VAVHCFSRRCWVASGLGRSYRSPQHLEVWTRIPQPADHRARERTQLVSHEEVVSPPLSYTHSTHGDRNSVCDRGVVSRPESATRQPTAPFTILFSPRFSDRARCVCARCVCVCACVTVCVISVEISPLRDMEHGFDQKTSSSSPTLDRPCLVTRTRRRPCPISAHPVSANQPVSRS
jgi:hypothetical protein